MKFNQLPQYNFILNILNDVKSFIDLDYHILIELLDFLKN